MQFIVSKAKAITENTTFRNAILGVIIFNAILLGLETSPALLESYGSILIFLDRLCLSIFVIELALKLIAQQFRFFKSGWNIFDFIIVSIAFIPNAGGLAVLRTLRIFRAFRLFAAVPSMRRLVAALLKAIPGVSSAIGLLAILFYVSAVVATSLFANAFPEWFGSLGKTLFTLFQVMTLESWSMGIARPVIAEFPYAWIFFVFFILVTSFTMLNVFIGIIVDAMSSIKEEEHAEQQSEHDNQLDQKLDEISQRLQVIEKSLKN
ncbi:ion transporter [Curvivirga sp.]|uniref:ion transporter n=1 Tax=Curvivirga sp. TaxID=2856848 RepID=UPI003B5A874F